MAGPFSAAPASIRLPLPQLGEHTDGILAELGCGAEHIAALRAQGVLG